MMQMKAWLCTLTAALLLSGCGSAADAPTLPASYTVPEGWVLSSTYSTDSVLFYIEEGCEDDTSPDNIAVSIVKTPYALEEHEQFRDDAVRQLLVQLEGVDAQLTGDGSYTAQGDVLYTFSIEEPDVLTVQHYVVGDRRCGLIQLTQFSGSDAAAEAARVIADSLVLDP